MTNEYGSEWLAISSLLSAELGGGFDSLYNPEGLFVV